LANAIRNAQLYQEVTERLEEVNALLQVAVSLTGASELDEVLKLILVEAMELTNTLNASILLWDAQSEKFIQAFRLDDDGVLRPYISQARPQGGRTRKIIDEKKPIAISDARQVPDFKPAFLKKGHRASLGVPLLSREEAIGVLYISSDEPRQFSQRQIVLLEGLASQAAVAVDRARQYDELKELDRKKTEFLSMVSHQLRTPLATVRAIIENLYDGVHGPLADEQQEKLKVVLRRVRKEARLIDQMLNLSRIQKGKVELALDRSSLKKMIHNVVTDAFEDHPDWRKINLSKELPADDSLEIEMDVEKIEQVLDNLINNAFKFTPHGGTVTITASRMGDQVEVRVIDTGIGIPPEEFEKIFDWFYQVDSSTTREFDGTGIGLYIARQFMKAHKGHISVVESRINQGSTFSFILPITQ
jgi:signal transduction histidine kinase